MVKKRFIGWTGAHQSLMKQEIEKINYSKIQNKCIKIINKYLINFISYYKKSLLFRLRIQIK
jgi:hypothetical protein